MGYLFHVVLALIAQGLAEAGVVTGWRAPSAVLALAAMPHLLVALARLAFVRGSFRAGEWILRAQSVSAPLGYALAVCAFGWQASVGAWVGGSVSFLAWPEPALLLALAPFVVYELAAIDARARFAGTTRRERRAWRAFQARMFLSGLLPVALYVVAASAVGWKEEWRVQVEQVALYDALFASALVSVLALFLPSLLRTTWETQPLAEGAQREVLLAVAERARFRSRALLVWRTGHTMANAAIVGLGPRSRVVLFSDSLLAQLAPRELAAVFAHEIGHAARRHVPIFALWVLAFFLAADLVAGELFPDDPWLEGGFVLLAMVGWYFAFGFLSRRFELDADLYSLELLGDRDALVDALEKVGGRLRDVASWRHFSVDDRVRFLARASDDPAVGRKLRRGLAWSTALAGAACAALIAVQLVGLVRALPEDRVEVDLRLGRYASAYGRVREDGERIGPRMRALAALSATLPDASAAERTLAGEVEQRARERLLLRDHDAALAWLELGALRGRDDLAEVADEVRRRLAGDAAPSTLAPELAEAWSLELAGANR